MTMASPKSAWPPTSDPSPRRAKRFAKGGGSFVGQLRPSLFVVYFSYFLGGVGKVGKVVFFSGWWCFHLPLSLTL